MLLYLIIVGPAFLIALWAMAKMRAAFARFSKVPSASGISGAQAARAILHSVGLEVDVEPVPGSLTDHYDPRKRVLKLSEPVYSGRSIAALGIAAHEAGHAIQHARGYVPLVARNFAFPLVALGSRMAMPLFMIGLLFSWAGSVFGPTLILVGIIAFSAVVIFQLVTLPVELNASKRALVLLTRQGMITQEEAGPVRKVLNAAALTYVAAAIQAILTLVYMILRSRD